MPPDENKCLEHGIKINSMAAQIEAVHESVNTIALYVPRIEVALERLANVQDSIRSVTDDNKQLGTLIRSQTREIDELKLENSKISGRTKVLEDSRRGALGVVSGIVSPVVTTCIIAAMMLLLIFAVSHSILPFQITTDSKSVR